MIDPLIPPGRSRRRRYHFTPEDDEKMVDCEAICRARHRLRNVKFAHSRLAFLQVFPDIGRQSIVSRVKRLLTSPGKQAYMERLEEAFYHLLLEHRGCAALPDSDPSSETEFDLPAHLQFLRDHVNKLNM